MSTTAPAPRAPGLPRKSPPGFFRTATAARPIVIGHRGVRRPGVAENTLPAFEASVREGAEAIELDVRVCASGELVVVHDPSLARVTGGADDREIAAVPFGDLARIDLEGGGRIPLLSEALAFARERRLPVNVEMKRDAPSRAAIVRAVARLVGGWDRAHAILVSSFDPAMLLSLRALAPRVPLAILVHRTRWHPLATRLAGPFGSDAVHIERTITRPDLVQGLKARGLFVNVWTVNDPREARDLAALGVDGLITDDPAAIREALA